jgi:hypothetical protein
MVIMTFSPWLSGFMKGTISDTGRFVLGGVHVDGGFFFRFDNIYDFCGCPYSPEQTDRSQKIPETVLDVRIVQISDVHLD